MARGTNRRGDEPRDPTIYGTAGDDIINVGPGDGDGEIVNGLAGNDTITGTTAGDGLTGGLGDDRLYGGGGNDGLFGGAGNDLMDGGLGADLVSYEDAVSAVTVSLAITTAQVTGGGGTDTLLNIEMLAGSLFGDTLSGNGDANIFFGNDGNDRIYGGGGDDTIEGNNGNDALYGGVGNDNLRPDGDAFPNVIGNDFIDGGAGVDSISYYFDTVTGVSIDMRIRTAQNTGGGGVETIRNVENVMGTIYADRIIGSNADNVFSGDVGSDAIYGLGGNDSIQSGGLAYGMDGNDYVSALTTAYGGIGDDVVIGGTLAHGGAGNDRVTGVKMTGDVGADTFVFTSNSGVAVTDFNRAQGDKFDLVELAASNIGSAVTFVGYHAYTSFAGHPEARVVAGAGFQTVEIDANGDRITDLSFKITGSAPLIESDFILV